MSYRDANKSSKKIEDEAMATAKMMSTTEKEKAEDDYEAEDEGRWK